MQLVVLLDRLLESVKYYCDVAALDRKDIE